MAKNIRIIVARSTGIGILLEGKKLEDYEKQLKLAQDAYKMRYKIIDSHGGKVIKCSFSIIAKQEATDEEFSAPFDQIIMYKDTNTIVQFKGDAFDTYQKQFCEGLNILGLKPQISGILVRVQTK